MGLLAARGLHLLDEERWNGYGQFTWISSFKPAFQAAYTNLNGSPNSLSPEAEHSFTASATAYFGLRLWSGGELYFVPEVISERPFSGLHGLAGSIQNFELQKTGGDAPQVYRSRAYLRQTFDLGGEQTQQGSDQLQLGGKASRRRVVVALGNFSILDFQGKNSLTSDTRRQFFSIAFMTHAAWDFASDARGYSWGGVVEVYLDDWALRLGRMSPPQQPNQLPVGLRLDRYYGDALEVEHQHTLFGREGVVRLLAFRNREVMGRFDDAVAALAADPGRNAAACTAFNYGSANGAAPDLCWVRRPNTKVGAGVDLEQRLTPWLGLFARAMFSDGETEVQAYTSADRSASAGLLAKGAPWGRPADSAGLGLAGGWISQAHAGYLARGGIDGFIGDGALTQGTEATLEAFYSVAFQGAVALSLDYQRIWNPAFNADRGPLQVFGVRLHAQY
jgi:hypothetical protein